MGALATVVSTIGIKDKPVRVMLAHSTHVRGSGVMVNGIEKANVTVTLASKITPEDCAKLNLCYLDPAFIDPADWQNRKDEGILYIARAGGMLYKVKK